MVSLRRPLALAALVGLTGVSACAGSNPGVEVAEVPIATEPTTPTTAPTPEAMVGAPAVGECRGPVTQAEIDPASDTRPAVPCTEPHGFETVHVGELTDAPDAWPGDELPPTVVDQVVTACQPALDAYLELPSGDGYVVPNRISDFAYFLPTAEEWSDGARWFRCDAYVTPLNATEQTSIDGSLEAVGRAALPAAYRICDNANGFVPCTDPHELEYVALVEAGQDTYPSVADPALAERCRAPVAQELAISSRSDLSFSVALPTQEAWQAGVQVIYCVVGAAGGEALVGTLAGIGDAAPLPIVGTSG